MKPLYDSTAGSCCWSLGIITVSVAAAGVLFRSRAR